MASQSASFLTDDPSSQYSTIEPRSGVLRFKPHDKRKTTTPNTGRRWARIDGDWDVVGGGTERNCDTWPELSGKVYSFALGFLPPLPEPEAALLIPRMRLAQRLYIWGERRAPCKSMNRTQVRECTCEGMQTYSMQYPYGLRG